MTFPFINKVSSILQEFSLVHQFSLMQREMETLARDEARFLEVTGNTISLLSALQENGDFQQRRSSQPMTGFAHKSTSN
ncbi:hypothetical protein [Sulfurimicrobium lacus]|uniref:hypothetical protein n=1 Tax=Sulfurimicrobium lacus TaxID=2715678 RepID=UPI001564E952|nr:hypothetical protein [Sulfurimicrobium lacus]